MKITITISMDNAAFSDAGLGNETARILRKLADDIENGRLTNNPGKLRDVNGNTVGKYTIGKR